MIIRVKDKTGYEILEILKDHPRILAEVEANSCKSEASLKAMKKGKEEASKKKQQKIIDTANRLRAEGRSVTRYSVAKSTGFTYNTVTKYKHLIEDQQLNLLGGDDE